MEKDQFLLSEFKKAFRKNAGDSVVNLDDKFPHKFDFFAQLYEEISHTIGREIPPHKWSYYRIGLVKQGSPEYTAGLYKFTAKKNTLIIIPARVVNTTSNWTPDCKGYLVVFNADFFLQQHFPNWFLQNKKILQPSIQPYLYLTEEQADEAEKIYKAILLEKNSDKLCKNELIAVKIIELLILIERIYSEIHEFEKDKEIVHFATQFSDLVEMNFTKERSVGFYARQLHIHPNYLNALVKKHMGLTAKDSIRNRLLLEIKYLLHSTNLSIKEISNQTGFNDPNYFTVFFRRCENISPAAYRASFV